jgi:hypothetical protein
MRNNGNLKTVNFTEEFLSLIQEDSEDWRSRPPASWRLDRCAPGFFKIIKDSL